MRNRRKAVSLLTGLLVTAQLFPTAALAADSSESALNKAPGYQDFPAYYSDSAHADDQVTHPDVVVLEEPWNGYRYTQALRDCLAHDAALYDPKKYGGPAREAVISLVRHRIKICAGKVGLIAPL